MIHSNMGSRCDGSYKGNRATATRRTNSRACRRCSSDLRITFEAKWIRPEVAGHQDQASDLGRRLRCHGESTPSFCRTGATTSTGQMCPRADSRSQQCRAATCDAALSRPLSGLPEQWVRAQGLERPRQRGHTAICARSLLRRSCTLRPSRPTGMSAPTKRTNALWGFRPMLFPEMSSSPRLSSLGPWFSPRQDIVAAA